MLGKCTFQTTIKYWLQLLRWNVKAHWGEMLVTAWEMSDNQFVFTRDRTNCSRTKAPQGACRHQFNHSCDSIWLQLTFGLLSQPQKHAALKLGMPNIGGKEASLPWGGKHKSPWPQDRKEYPTTESWIWDMCRILPGIVGDCTGFLWAHKCFAEPTTQIATMLTKPRVSQCRHLTHGRSMLPLCPDFWAALLHTQPQMRLTGFPKPQQTILACQ